MNGSVAFNTTLSDIYHSYDPSANINVHSGRLDFYASVWASPGGDTKAISNENTIYSGSNKGLTAHSVNRNDDESYGVNAGSIFELDEKNSIGAEFSYWRGKSGGPNQTSTDLSDGSEVVNTRSIFDSHSLNNTYAVTFNYIHKLDTPRLDPQAAGRLHPPQLRLGERQLEPHHHGQLLRRLALPRQRHEHLRRGNGYARPRKELLAPLDAEGRCQVHLQRHAQHRPLRIPEGRRLAAQRQPELHDQLHRKHRGSLRHRLGPARTLEPGGRSARRVHPHLRQGQRRQAGLLLALPQRQHLLRPFAGEGLLADPAVCPHDRAPALLVPQPAADADLRLHLSDR